MRQTLLLERVMDQTRLAVIEDGALCELYEQRPDTENLTGNIYLGRVENVLPGMNAAFVDIGLEKNGFLGAADIRLLAQGDPALARAVGGARIEALARPGQQIPVQVVRSQPGAKGPRLSCHITLPGRTMVLLAGVSYVGVSRKIGDEGERNRLRQVGERLTAGSSDGLILRTAAQGVPEAELEAEYERLRALHGDISRRGDFEIAPKLLYSDDDLALRCVRDMLSSDVDAVWADDDLCYQQLLEYANTLAPHLTDKIKRHEGTIPLFDLYRVDSQLEKALQKNVWLKDGGSLVIEETEALTVVDVNTGKNTGRRDSDETILQTNIEAARELMRQLRLRDIGGAIVVDFITMRRKDDRQALLDALRECAARDRNRTTVVDITALGLVELTRRRARQSLSRQLLHTCSTCGGNGIVPSHETTARRALRELWRRRRAGDATALRLEAEPAVCGWMRKIGTPAGGAVELVPTEALGAGGYRFSPMEHKD